MIVATACDAGGDGIWETVSDGLPDVLQEAGPRVVSLRWAKL